jgi:predicted nuclease of predicted toxin-antitoxin system
VRLLIDEMWEPDLAIQLRQRGYDVVSVHERLELQGRSDELVLAAAQREHRVIVSENRGDFRRLARQLHSQGNSHCGMIFPSPRTLSRHHSRTLGRMIRALIQVLEEDPDLTNLELWLA